MVLRPCTAFLLACLFLFSAGAAAQEADKLIADGDTLLAADQGSKAMEKFEAALRLGPTADAYAARARGWFFLGKPDKFMEDVRHALALDSLHAKANYQRALFALRANDTPHAVQFASVAAASNDPEVRARALVLRGEAHAAMGLNDKAIADLVEGLAGNTQDLAAMKTLARLHDQADDPAASLAVLETLCVLQPDDIGNWSNRGFELGRLERYAESVEVLDKALAIDKDEPVVLSNKAYALLKLDRDKEAFTAVNRSLKADAVNPYALRTRALLYLRKGDRSKACNDLTLAKAMGGAPEVDALVKEHCAGMPGKR